MRLSWRKVVAPAPDMRSFAQLLDDHVAWQAKQPHDFSAVLDAIYDLTEILIHHPSSDAWYKGDNALDVLRRFSYERATPEEMHERAERGRTRIR